MLKQLIAGGGPLPAAVWPACQADEFFAIPGGLEAL